MARAVLVGPTLGPVRRIGRRLAAPLPAFVAFSVVLLGWHLPPLYDLTLRNVLVHDLEHMLFFSTALLLWVHLVPAATPRPKLSDGQRVAYGTAALLVSWVLAVVLGFALGARLRRVRVAREPSRRDLGAGRPADRCGDHVGARFGAVPDRDLRRCLSLARSVEQPASGSSARSRPSTEGDLMTVASFQTGSLLTLLLPLALLIGIGVWWGVVIRRRREL